MNGDHPFWFVVAICSHDGVTVLGLYKQNDRLSAVPTACGVAVIDNKKKLFEIKLLGVFGGSVCAVDSGVNLLWSPKRISSCRQIYMFVLHLYRQAQATPGLLLYISWELIILNYRKQVLMT